MNENKLKKSLVNLYGIPELGFSLFIYVELYYFSAFLTDYAKFSLTTVALILTLTAAIDLIWVPVTGIIIEKCDFKWGKYRSWFLVGPPFVVLFFTLMFTRIGPEILAASIVVGAFAAKTLAQDIIYTAHASQMSVISNDPMERTLLASRKIQYSTLGVLIFSAIGLPAIMFFGGFTNVMLGYTITAFVFSLIYFITCLILFKLTENVEKKTDAIAKKEDKMSVRQMMKAVGTNPPLLAMIIADSGRQLGLFLIIATSFYYFKVVLNDMALMTTYLLTVNIAGFAGSFLTTSITKWFGKKRAYVFVLLGTCTCLMLAYFFGGQSAVLFIVLLTIAQMLMAPTNALLVAIVADTVVYDEFKHEVPARGFIMSMLNVPIKAGAMLRSIFLPMGLVAAGYAADKVTDTNMIRGITNMITIYPCIAIGFAIIVIALFYHLSETQVMEMTGEINARKTN